ncbi:MAG: uncharacterized protein H6Q90_5543 [Deltaproteobacteria bacterium]|nr:uncharacterized protein [Deltaproteobacteria bacterium]
MTLTHLPRAGRLTLSPRVGLAAYFATVPGPTGRVTADTSLPISLFVPPDRLGPLQYLAARLNHAWRTMVNAAISRGRLPEPDRTAAILDAICRELVRDHPALGKVVRAVGDPVRLEALVPLQDDTIHYPLDRFACFQDRELARLTAPPVRTVVPADGPPVAAFGQLLGRLATGIDANELRAELGAAAPALAQLVSALWFASLLDGRPPARPLALEPGTVAHLGHATLLANLGGHHVLVDPWLPPASTGDVTPPVAPGELPPLAALFITHHHWDHVHPDTLLKLDKRTPIYVPAQDATRTLSPRTELLLRYLGFTSIHTLRHGEAISFGEAGEVVAAPFYGEDPTRLHFGGNCYLLRHAGKSALVHVDSSADLDGRSLVTTGDAAALVARYGPLEPVFATRRQERGTMIDHTWEFLFQAADRWVRPTENCDNGAAFLADLTRATGAKTLVVYSEGGAAWYPPGTDFLRGASSAALMAPHEYLWEPLDVITAAITAAGATLQLSRPFDRFTIGG